MNFPGTVSVLIITLSDRAYRGEYNDISGPRIKELLSDFFREQGWSAKFSLNLIPDDQSMLEGILKSAGNNNRLIFTTGGTGLGPRDITVDTVKPLLSKEIPGIMEFIRIRYGAQKPNALLSRSVAGMIGETLIFTLPGSVKAVEEYMTEILKVLRHTMEMISGIDRHPGH